MVEGLICSSLGGDFRISELRRLVFYYCVHQYLITSRFVMFKLHIIFGFPLNRATCRATQCHCSSAKRNYKHNHLLYLQPF
jgi:hypothetical protein